ncbi:hypothetical protein [Mesorhizobium sp.]|uniref:hypothetical protein n=1 Tax=Mesorhizobium sp. TaxID=1871066 RepID=UPI000FEA5981|nr:hypothetical protein [Mesorhizobium sp.]RWM57438.1 MAG: hypothetical protein EOR78_09200 [Mesorhizobium sp.]RWM59082.1 MAG: hypothetical protein EOR79_12230 [Mesorhizobium sp.]RWM93319.1 MAG: hypothetical protein EOR85_27095 [Mesorhizobium sp.]TIO70370.1 MAG: hypothetical protein E5X85_07515 [Mesorhizobium sp.]TJV92037.1 MAG: hypothetical protein E5X84_08515 [Mesorhizobium sp.]
MLDGFYVGYMSADGYGVVLFVFKGKAIVGVDAGGVKFDGNFDQDPATKAYSGKISVDAPPNIDLIQGINTGPNGLKYEVPFTMPENFLEAPFIKITTPFGAVNVKLEKLRDLGDAA